MILCAAASQVPLPKTQLGALESCGHVIEHQVVITLDLKAHHPLQHPRLVTRRPWEKKVVHESEGAIDIEEE